MPVQNQLFEFSRTFGVEHPAQTRFLQAADGGLGPKPGRVIFIGSSRLTKANAKRLKLPADLKRFELFRRLACPSLFPFTEQWLVGLFRSDFPGCFRVSCFCELQFKHSIRGNGGQFLYGQFVAGHRVPQKHLQ